MNRMLILLLTALFTTACSDLQAQSSSATPTPEPPAAALERPLYTVQRGSVERFFELSGRITPVDLERLAFAENGRVARVMVERGDQVEAGDLLAELIQEDQLAALATAELALSQAERDLEAAHQRGTQAVEQAQLALNQAIADASEAAQRRTAVLGTAERELERAQADLETLLNDGPQSLIEQAEREVQASQRMLARQRDEASEVKTRAEHALISTSEAVQIAQQRWSDAFWDWEWVREHGTHPREKQIDPASGRSVHRKLEEHEQEQFARQLEQAERDLASADRALELAKRDVELARAAEITSIQEAEQALADAQRKLDLLRQGQGNPSLAQAQRRVQDASVALEQARSQSGKQDELRVAQARLALRAAQQDTLHSQRNAVDEARNRLEQAQRAVNAGQIVAPHAGVILAINIGPGDSVEAYNSVLELGDPAQLEVAAELSASQMQELSEGQAASISLVSRPAEMLSAKLRRLPAPYGSGGSGAIAEEDRSSRFAFEQMPTGLSLGAVAKIKIVVERRNDVLWLPPDAIRSYEGRNFVIVRQSERELRVPVQIGVVNQEQVEIISGLEAGDLVVGQ
jgi:RND family efflux transporter MFP subunit